MTELLEGVELTCPLCDEPIMLAVEVRTCTTSAGEKYAATSYELTNWESHEHLLLVQ